MRQSRLARDGFGCAEDALLQTMVALKLNDAARLLQRLGRSMKVELSGLAVMEVDGMTREQLRECVPAFQSQSEDVARVPLESGRAAIGQEAQRPVPECRRCGGRPPKGLVLSEEQARQAAKQTRGCQSVGVGVAQLAAVAETGAVRRGRVALVDDGDGISSARQHIGARHADDAGAEDHDLCHGASGRSPSDRLNAAASAQKPVQIEQSTSLVWYSGCHWRPRQKHRSGTSIASTTPSGAWATAS